MRISLFLTLLLLLLAKHAYAYTCTFDTAAFTLPATTIYVDSAAIPGQKIGSPIIGNKTYMACSNVSDVKTQKFLIIATGEHLQSLNGSSLLAYDGLFIYKTGISGIGFAVGGSANCNSKISWVDSGSGFQPTVVCQSLTGSAYKTYQAMPTVQLYRTHENIVPGVNKVALGTIFVNFDNAMPVENGKTAKAASFSLNLTIKKMTCKVLTETLPVALPPITKPKFDGFRSWAGETAFGIDLTCGEETPIALRFDSSSIASAPPPWGTLKNEATGSDAASGVGIQLVSRDGHNPFSIGYEKDLGKTTAGTTRISLFARYSQLDKEITPGKVKSSATFTIIYK